MNQINEMNQMIEMIEMKEIIAMNEMKRRTYEFYLVNSWVSHYFKCGKTEFSVVIQYF